MTAHSGSGLIRREEVANITRRKEASQGSQRLVAAGLYMRRQYYFGLIAGQRLIAGVHLAGVR
jgi:hypothetical protein